MHFELHVRGCQCLKDATLTIELKSFRALEFFCIQSKTENFTKTACL